MKNFILLQLAKLRRAWRSWTINWGMLLMIVGYFNDNISQVLPFVRKYIPSEQVGLFVVTIGFVVVLLRFKTSKPLAEK